MALPLPKPKGGFAFGGADPKTYLPTFSGGVSNIDELTVPAQGVGSFSFPTGADGVVRTTDELHAENVRKAAELDAQLARGGIED